MVCFTSCNKSCGQSNKSSIITFRRFTNQFSFQPMRCMLHHILCMWCGEYWRRRFTLVCMRHHEQQQKKTSSAAEAERRTSKQDKHGTTKVKETETKQHRNRWETTINIIHAEKSNAMIWMLMSCAIQINYTYRISTKSVLRSNGFKVSASFISTHLYALIEVTIISALYVRACARPHFLR